MIDIVIPVLNEERILHEKKDYYGWLKNQARVIFVDGGSRDATVERAREYGDVIVSPPGRAAQKNAGAALCRREYILFLHADTFLTQQAWTVLISALKRGVPGGCFMLAVDDPRFIFRIFEFIVNVRAKYFQVIDGDLGLFVRRDIFEKVGGFDDVPIMEDILFSPKLRGQARGIVLPEKILVLSRAWDEKWFWATLGQYTKAYVRMLRRKNGRL